MFNDLSSPGNPSRPAVDDIFAETDKVSENRSVRMTPGGKADIETHKVGLTSETGAAAEAAVPATGGKWFKIVLITLVAIVVVLGGYLLYSRMFKATPGSTVSTPTDTVKITPPPSTPPTGSFVATTTGQDEVATTTIPLIPGVNAPAATTTASTTITTPPIDSDSDGLTDAEEKTAGTNINLIDTDNDGLSDYEEVKIYHTNPLSADTDGDGYLDGAEVKSGYNPNGPGKLPGLASTTPSTAQ